MKVLTDYETYKQNYRECNKASDISLELDVSVIRIEGGDKTSFVAIHNDKIIHRSIVSHSSFVRPRLKETIRINPKEAYVYNIYTVPEYRDRSVAPFVLQYIHKYLAESGIKKCIAHVWIGNETSVRMFLKMGYLEVGRMNLIKAGNCFFWIITGSRDFFQNKAPLRCGKCRIYYTKTRVN